MSHKSVSKNGIDLVCLQYYQLTLHKDKIYRELLLNALYKLYAIYNIIYFEGGNVEYI